MGAEAGLELGKPWWGEQGWDPFQIRAGVAGAAAVI